MSYFSKETCPMYELGGMNGLEAEILCGALYVAAGSNVARAMKEHQGMDVPSARVSGVLSNLHKIIYNLLDKEKK